MLKIRDTDKEFELQGDLLKMISERNFYFDLAKLSDKKLMFEFAEDMYFDEKALGKKSTKNKSLIRLLKSPAAKAGSLKDSNTRWLSSILANFVMS